MLLKKEKQNTGNLHISKAVKSLPFKYSLEKQQT